jgi:hypothetical protein
VAACASLKERLSTSRKFIETQIRNLFFSANRAHGGLLERLF